MITVRENESVVEAVKKFAQYKVGRLLVVNEQGPTDRDPDRRRYYPGLAGGHQP